MEAIVLVDGKPATGGRINAENSSQVEVKTNSGNLDILFPKKVIVCSNDSNLSIYGEHAEIEIENNNSNLHIYGDHLHVVVKNNDCNLHILGLHNIVDLMKGSATVFGDYGSVNVFEGAEAKTAGDYKKNTKIS